MSDNETEAETEQSNNSDYGSNNGGKHRTSSRSRNVPRRRRQSSRKRRRPKGYSDDEEEETDEDEEDEIGICTLFVSSPDVPLRSSEMLLYLRLWSDCSSQFRDDFTSEQEKQNLRRSPLEDLVLVEVD